MVRDLTEGSISLAYCSQGPYSVGAYSFFVTRPMAKMTKSQLMDTLATKTGFPKKQVLAVVLAMVTVAYSETKKNGEFTIPGLGKLVKKRREARMGRNPATGAEIKIPAKTVVKFRVAKAAKDSIL